MKKLRLLVSLLFLVLFLGCYDVNEEVVINKNGSGTYHITMDMGGMLDLLEMMVTEEEMKTEGLFRSIDTTILFKDVLDSAENLTTKEKAVMKNGKVHLKIDRAQKIFKADLDFPFKTYSELQQLMTQPNGNAGLSKAFQSFLGGEHNPSDTANAGVTDRAVDPGIDQLGQIYEVTVKDGFISKKIDQAKLNQIMQRPEMAQLKELKNSGLEINYSTNIKLPRPVKKVDNPVVKLSQDKKTVSIKYGLMDMLENPEKYSWSISF